MAMRLSALRAVRPLILQEDSWYSFLLEAIVWLDGSGQLENPMASSEFEPVTSRLVLQCLNQLYYCVHLLYIDVPSLFICEIFHEIDLLDSTATPQCRQCHSTAPFQLLGVITRLQVLSSRGDCDERVQNTVIIHSGLAIKAGGVAFMGHTKWLNT
jgi:hypothetical protein